MWTIECVCITDVRSCLLLWCIWQLCELESIVPLDCVRLVKYDSLHDYIDRSFDGEESQPMYKILGGVRFIYSFDLLLEIKRPDQIFLAYHPGGTVSLIAEIFNCCHASVVI